MKKTPLIWILVALLFAITMTACGQQSSDSDADIPDEITDFYEKYMEACKVGVEEAVQYIHFENDNRSAYLESNNKLIDYKIENTEKINDDLYAFIVSVSDAIYLDQPSVEEGSYKTAYNFVGRIDGELYVMNGVRQIPESIRDNLDEDEYTYTDENIVG